MNSDIRTLRREFMSEGIDPSQLSSDPIQQFSSWFEAAQQGGLEDVNAFSLASSDAQGSPSIRTVLLKEWDDQGFVFYTNYDSRKSAQLDATQRAAMLFAWLPLDRQIKIEGKVERVSEEQSEAYFRVRPRGSQVGAWSSAQSSVIPSREALEDKYAEVEARFADAEEVPLPPFWGGYRVIPERIEFWQGRENRLHDRVEYQLQANGEWLKQRLSP